MADSREHPTIRIGALSITLRGPFQRFRRFLPSTGVQLGDATDGRAVRRESISPIGCREASLKETRHAARFVACPFTEMEPPSLESARVVFDLILRMAAGDMEAAAEFQSLVEGPSPWEELRG